MFAAICVLVLVLLALLTALTAKAVSLSDQLNGILLSFKELVKINSDLVDINQNLVNDLERADKAKEHWKSYAIAYETFAECLAEYDDTGAENARDVLQQEREALQNLGEYD